MVLFTDGVQLSRSYRVAMRRQISRRSWCLFDRPRKDERLSRPWSHPVYRVAMRRQISRRSWCLFDRPRKDERLSRPWSHPVVWNRGPLDWESSTLTTRPWTSKWPQIPEKGTEKNSEKCVNFMDFHVVIQEPILCISIDRRISHSDRTVNILFPRLMKSQS